MSKAGISCSLEDARRLQITKQHLAGKLPGKATSDHMLSVVRDTCYIQWDPIAAVAPSHVIAFWSRVGKYRLSDLDRLLWDERKLFLNWNPMASIVLTEDYPIYSALMRRYRDPLSKSSGKYLARSKKFLVEHKELRSKLLSELKAGPKRLGDFKGYVPKGRAADGWSSGSEVSKMLFLLLLSGEVMVVGHEGNQNVWGLTGNFPPKSAEKRELSEDEFEREAAQRAIRALGIAFAREIYLHFPRDRYLNLDKTLKQLKDESIIQSIKVEGLPGKQERFIHEKDIPLLESIDSTWQPRTTLLAPFDNLLTDRARTNRLFSFDYMHENFLPESKRKYGTFVHPILWGDTMIGRADLLKDKATGNLLVNSVHAEPGAPGKEVGTSIAETMEDFGEFLGTKEIVYTSRVPAAWKSSLR